jgi:hypothetical protein
MIYKTLHRKLEIEQRDSHKNQGWTQVLRMRKQLLLYYWHPSCYSGYKLYEWGKDGIVITSSEIYPWSFETRIFRIG